MPKFTYVFDIAFSVLTDEKLELLTGKNLRTAIHDRLSHLSDDELVEACGQPLEIMENSDV